MNELNSKHDKEGERILPPVERTYFGDLDVACVDRIAQRYSDVVPPERIAAMRDLPTHFEGGKEFAAVYEKATGQSPEKGVLGFSNGLDSPAYVSTENLGDVPEITMHERIHQAAHPDAGRILGSPLCEGITQDLTIAQLGREPEPGEATGYPMERHSASILREVCGGEAVENAYFQGNVSELKVCLDRNLGGGAERLRERMKTWDDIRQEG